MTFSKGLLAMMPQTITVNAYASMSTDGYGANVYSTTAYSVKCYITDKTQLIKNALTGRETISTREIYCAPYDTSSGQVSVRIQVSDKITLPSTAFNPQTPPIINIVHYDDRQGYFAQVIYI